MTFDLSPLIVCDIIVRAREFYAKEGVVIPENVKEPTEAETQSGWTTHTAEHLLSKPLVADLSGDGTEI
ncbi:hypothetical protein [Coxiella-like endosymbiont]|uniref:hypothetical protein n=1 Tax=Coxiella-like endosymbiont TaxID=1592897 RepID=UPI00272D0794|nr:hypothetical protein [Coxiella-like endosymbiont]